MHLPKLASLAAGFRSTLLRFPTPTLYATLTTGLFIFAVESKWDDTQLLRWILLTGLGFVASLLCNLMAEARNTASAKVWLGQTGIVGLLVLYSNLIMPAQIDASRPPFFYSYFILLFALHLGIALVPAWARRDSQQLWQFNLTCFLRFCFSSVNAALLYAGLALALLSVDKLFEIGLHEELYLQLWLLCAFFAHPILFLGGLPRLEQMEASSRFPKPLHFSLCFIGLPLVALYLLILYAYLVKIILQWNWPNGWVAMPIFVLAVISLLTYLLSLPLSPTENWARRYRSWLFRLLLPLAIVLFLALQIRLGDYGMTINRYLGLTLAVWLFGISLAYLIRPALNIAWLPLSLLLVALGSIYAGPLGAFGWSERAQLGRLRSMAADLGAIENGILVPATAASDPVLVKNFQSALSYLIENFGAEALEPELAGFKANRSHAATGSGRNRQQTNRIMNYLELDTVLGKTSTRFYAKRTVLPTHGQQWMVELHLYRNRSRQSTNQFSLLTTELSFDFDPDASQLSIQADDASIADIDLKPWAADIAAAVKKQGEQSEEPLVWHVAANGWRFSFLCTNAGLEHPANTFSSARFAVMLTPPE